MFQQEMFGAQVPSPEPRRDVRLLWLLGDLDQFLIRLKQDGLTELPEIAREIARTRAGNTLDFDTLKSGDPIPFLVELLVWLKRELMGRLSTVSFSGRGI
jgi:hypothetical protein